MKRIIEITRRYYLIFVLISIGLSILFYILSNTYEIKTITINRVVENKVDSKVVYFFENSKLLFQILSNIFLDFSVATFITIFFVNYIDKQEKEDFQKRLLDFQKDTAKDAIESVFNRIIEKEFFDIIKNDLLNAKLLRKNAKWLYDIKEEAGSLVLERTLNYKLKNLTQDSVKEPIHLVYSNNIHANSKIEAIKVKLEGGEFKDIVFSQNTKGDGFDKDEELIEIKPFSEIEVIIILKQIFKREYIYETHFTAYPIINLEINVNYPAGYTFELSGDSMSTKYSIKLNTDTKKIYEFVGSIYKGQGIEFLCRKK